VVAYLAQSIQFYSNWKSDLAKKLAKVTPIRSKNGHRGRKIPSYQIANGQTFLTVSSYDLPCEDS
jgi:hypothetical protein